jgi:predicted nucleic acid-binding protein
MQQLLRAGQAGGNLAHDAHIAALILEHGVRELWTADRDFARFPGLRLHDPFAPGA